MRGRLTSPYLLPDGNVQISFSGGRTSGYMLHQILEANGGLPDRCEVVFANTGREFPQTLDFVAECGSRWGVGITWVEYRDDENKFAVVGRQGASENGEPFEALIRRKKYCPNVVAKFCTQDLKIQPAKRYLMSLGWTRWIAAVGFRDDENRRAGRPLRERWTRWFPLIDAAVDKHVVAAFWRRQPFDLRLENIGGKTPRGNCDGCFLKSESNLAAFARDFPDRHAWWERMETLAAGLGAKPSGSRFNEAFTRVQVGEMVKRQGDLLFNKEGLLCQADGGECVGA